MHEPHLHQGPEKGYCGTSGENLISSVGDAFFNVIYLVLTVVLWLCKMSTFGDEG